MGDSNSGYGKLTVSIDGDRKTISHDEKWFELVDDFVEKSNFNNRSAAIRALVVMGMRSFIYDDPRNNGDSTPEGDRQQNLTPVRDLIPEGKSNSIDLLNELPDKFENKVIDIIEEDPKIKREGLEVWR